MSRVRVGVIPAAGLGTRMLPATAATPKELLPVGGRPAIDWVIDELAQAGLEQVVIVSSRRKPTIETYLTQASTNFEPQTTDARHFGLDIKVVYQDSPMGLGDAVRVGAKQAAGEPVVVILPDELLFGGPSLLVSMLDCHERSHGSVVSVMRVTDEEISSYGCAVVSTNEPIVVAGCVEKPAPEDAPSRYALTGRYVLTAEVIKAIDETPPGHGGEIQLTNALDRVARTNPILAVEVRPDDQRVDIGNWSGWLYANHHAFDFFPAEPRTVPYRMIAPA